MGAERHAKLFRNGRSQAVRIPREFEMPGDSVLIRKEGERLVIEPRHNASDIARLLETWRKEPPLAADEAVAEIDDLPAEPFDL